jgi:hypothetical protein
MPARTMRLARNYLTAWEVAGLADIRTQANRRRSGGARAIRSDSRRNGKYSRLPATCEPANIQIVSRLSAFLLLAEVALAQLGVPHFTREGVIPVQTDGPALLEEGSAPIKISVRDSCSDPVVFRFATHKAYIQVQGQAYVHMPVWIEIAQPSLHRVYYPVSVGPWDFAGDTLEVRRNGRPLTPIRPLLRGGLVDGTVAPQDSPRDRLPLHLFYRLDLPGTYSARFTHWEVAVIPGTDMLDLHHPKIAWQSDWTDFSVAPYPEARRDEWLQAEAIKAQSASPGELVGDIVPSLAACPDKKALVIILKLVDHPDNLVKEFARQCLAAFDRSLLRRVIPPGRFTELTSLRIRL